MGVTSSPDRGESGPAVPGGTLAVPRRFRGPARSGNGGWTAGSLAEPLLAAGAPAVEVTLRRPPPLDTEMAVRQGGPAGAAEGPDLVLTDRDDLVAEASTCTRELTPVEGVEPTAAGIAMTGYRGLDRHPFPECFVCGPDREIGNGLRIFPGPVEGRDDTVASLWVPHESLAEAGDLVDGVDRVGVATAWAALDCAGGWSEDLLGRPCVLGRMAARIDALPVVGETHVVVGHRLRVDGRKTLTAATLYDADGRVVATAEHVWIAVDPRAFA